MQVHTLTSSLLCAEAWLRIDINAPHSPFPLEWRSMSSCVIFDLDSEARTDVGVIRTKFCPTMTWDATCHLFPVAFYQGVPRIPPGGVPSSVAISRPQWVRGKGGPCCIKEGERGESQGGAGSRSRIIRVDSQLM